MESGGIGFFSGMEEFQTEIILGEYGNLQSILSPKIIESKSFEKKYTEAANNYANHNKKNKKNNHGNKHYKKSTTIPPYSLQRIVVETYKKKKR
jgi:hypothetical protein